MHRSTKRFSGYSCCFRQWRATHSHCRFLHGYALSFVVEFSGVLDHRNWVCDFGSFSSNGVKDRLRYLFDHTTVIAEDDPHLSYFQDMHEKGLIQLRICTAVGAEKFAEMVYEELSQLLSKDLHATGRVAVSRVECFENENNSAVFIPDSQEGVNVPF